MPRKPRKVTWIEVAVRNAGVRRAFNALTWAQMWAIVRAAIGHDPTVEEVAAWWKQSLRTTYREQADFRAAFPTMETPARIFEDPALQETITKLAQFGEEMDERKRSRKRLSELNTLELGMAAATI